MFPAAPAWPPELATVYGVLAAIVVAAAIGLLCRPLLAHVAKVSHPDPDQPDPDHPDPDQPDPDQPDTDRPPDYRALGTGRFVAAVSVTALVAGLVVVGWAPQSAWPVWCGLCSLGVLLGWIDAATTWLPTALVRPLWALTAAGIVGTGVLSWFEDPGTWWIRPVTALAAATGYGLFFALVWRLARGGLGFGDVRLAVALGAATGACSATTAILAAILGTVLGALWAIGRLATGRREPYPYGPFLLLGAVLAPILS